MKTITLLFGFVFSLPVNSQTLSLGDTVRQIKISKGQLYLNFPVAETNRLTHTKISANGKTLDQFTMKLATAHPDYWVFFDATPYQGQTLTVAISQSNAGRGASGNTNQTMQVVKNDPNEDPSKGLQMVYADSKFPGQDSLYTEQGRPQGFHWVLNSLLRCSFF